MVLHGLAKLAHAHEQDVKTSIGTWCSYKTNIHAHCRATEPDRGHKTTCLVDLGSAL